MEQEKVSALVAENMKTIFAYALSRISPREDAEDLAGDIILAILQSAPRIRDDNAFFGYIWAIAANTYKKFLRKRSHTHFEMLEEEIASEDDFTQEILNAAEFNALRRELALLSREYRECTIAYYFDGLSCAETASKLNISLEMVKYYLFKTRKILKEGISMEREFGTKSYQPALFRFTTIFSGSFNAEYQNLFNRKLPGNILASAYYTPMSVKELAIELGVASVYLEDEIALLEKYHLLTSLPGGKYQTHLVLLTEDYLCEFYRTAEKSFTADVGVILSNVKGKLAKVRSLRFIGSDMDDNRLLWSLLFEMIRSGWNSFKEAHGDRFQADELFRGAFGTCYGITYEPTRENVYESNSFAGYWGINRNYAVSYADMHILPEKNWYTPYSDQARENLDAMLAGSMAPVIPIVSQKQLQEIKEILRPEIAAFGRLYESLYTCASQIMQVHAPKSVAPIAGKVVANSLLFHTVGLLGAFAVKSGGLTIPDNDIPLAAIIYQTGE